jgi:Tol biopolymer transport system component
MPQFVGKDVIGYLGKAGPTRGLVYTGGGAVVAGDMRSPAWSPDGTSVVYERVGFKPRPQNLKLYSWDPAYEYRYTDVFPSFAKDGTLVVTRKDGDSSIDIMAADGSNRREVFPSNGGSAFSPEWSPDGQSIVFAYGGFLQSRNRQPAKIMMVRRDGTNLTTLTDGSPNAGFPSWSPDGTRVVYRVWGGDVQGLRIMNLADRSVQVLTTDYDNLPQWSPDGTRILFTRRHSGFNFDIFTIRPDGTDPQRLTTSPANDAHAVWTDDGQHIMWNSGMYGWKEEAALYDRTFQPYGQIFIMKADGTGLRQLTDSLWEDAMPRFVPGRGRTTPESASR